MRAATASELRDHNTSLPGWVKGGEKIIIAQRGKPVARVIAGNPTSTTKVRWEEAPEESFQLIGDAASQW